MNNNEFTIDTGLFPSRYGLSANIAPVEEMLEACCEQGIVQTRFEANDVFIPLDE